jgi:hypothetical protein
LSIWHFFKRSLPVEVNLGGRLNKTHIAMTESRSLEGVVVLSLMMENSSQQLSEIKFKVVLRLVEDMMVEKI